MATLANLNVIIGADSTGLTRGLRGADKQTRKFSSSAKKGMGDFRGGMNTAVKSVFNLKSAIGVLAGSAGVGLLVSKQLEAIDSTAKLADRIGESTEEIVGLRHAAELTGAGSDKMNAALNVMSKRLGEAKQGSGEAGASLEALGIDINDIIDLKPGEQMRVIADEMKGVETQSEKNAIASDLFSRANQDLVNTLELGSEGLDAAREEAEKLGLSFGRIDAAKVEAANDAITRAQASFAGVGRVLTVELAPYIQAVADYIREASVEAGGFKNEIINGVESAINSIGFVADAIEGVRRTFELAGKGFAVFVLRVKEGALAAADYIVNYPTRATNSLIDLLNEIPGIDLEMSGLSGLGKDINQEWIIAKKATEAGIKDLQATLMEPMPSGTITNFLDEVRQKADESAAAVAESKKSMTASVAAGEGEEGSKAEQVDTQLQEQLLRIQEAAMTENELLRVKYEEQRNIVAEAFEVGLVDEQERKELMEQLEADHYANLKSINQKGLSDIEKLKQTSWQNQTKTVLGNLADMTAGVAQGNRTMFEINKAAALAEAALSLKATVVDAYRWGTAVGGPFVGAAYAAIAGAAQVANMADIANTSFGASTAPSVGGTSATPVTDVSSTESGPVEPQEEPTQRIYVEFEGEDDQKVSLKSYREQIRRLKEENPDAELVF